MGLTSGHRYLGFVGGPSTAARPLVVLFHAVAYCAGRKTTPCGTSPFSTRRQSAISSLRASATIIVLRVLARLSVVRAANHWARAVLLESDKTPSELDHAAPDASITGARKPALAPAFSRSEEHTSELQSHVNLVCRLLL